jgi:hypothetical protein
MPGPLVVADVTYQYIPDFSFQIWNWKASKTFSMAQTQYIASARLEFSDLCRDHGNEVLLTEGLPAQIV